jgi:hypothetical protein
MNHTDGSPGLRGRAPRVSVLAAAAAMAVLAGACGAGSRSSVPGTGSAQLTVQQLDVFAQCIRSHGFPGFYFESSSTHSGDTMFGYSVPANIQYISPQFQAAMKACSGPLGLPSGAPPNQAAQLRQELKAAACVRAHGYPTFPDPQVQGGVISNPVPAGVDINSPQFQAVLRTCHAGEPGSGVSGP